MSKRQLTPFGITVISGVLGFYFIQRFFTKISRGIRLKRIRKERSKKFDFKSEKAKF